MEYELTVRKLKVYKVENKKNLPFPAIHANITNRQAGAEC